MQETTGALILAAGKGTRMPSPRPKALQTLLGESMLALVLEETTKLSGLVGVWTLVGHQAELVRAEAERAAAALPPSRAAVPVFCLEQRQQLGTGHALMTALPEMLRQKSFQRLLVLNGDVPLLSAAILTHFIHEAENCDLAFLSLKLPEPGAYGRVVRDGKGRVQAIVEAKDYDPTLHGADLHEINSGIYLIRREAAETLLPRLNNNNRSGEYYITDLVKLAAEQGLDVRGIPAPSEENEEALLGANTPAELASAESLLQKRRIRELLKAGVILHAPESSRVSPLVELEAGAELTGPCEVSGRSVIRHGAVIASHCVIRNAVIGEDCRVHSFCHIEDARMEARCLVGPYARLRPGAVLEEDAHMGNFVEMKKARLGKGSKANHLSYLGDAEVGPGVNIGAGTITCNYDGTHKHRTLIGAGSFIGSNTALVAPVELGENTLVGAGSVITRNVHDGELAVARSRQVNLPRKK